MPQLNIHIFCEQLGYETAEPILDGYKVNMNHLSYQLRETG